MIPPTEIEIIITTSVRVLILIASLLMSWWGIKSFVVRCRLKICDFSDFSLVVVAVYWLLYSIWTLLVSASIANVESLYVWTFNMRFGLLLTICAFCALVKDRILISEMYEGLKIVKDKIENDEVKGNEPEQP